MYVDVFQDSTGVTNFTTAERDSSEFIHSRTTSTADTTTAINFHTKTTYTPFDSNRFSFRKNTSGISSYDGAGNLFDWSASNTGKMGSGANMSAGQVLSVGNEVNLWNAMFSASAVTGQSSTEFLADNDDTTGAYGNRNTTYNYAMPTGNSIKINGNVTGRWRNGAGNFNSFAVRGVSSSFVGTQLGELNTYNGGVSNGNNFTIACSSSTFYPAFSLIVQHTNNNSYMFDTLVLPTVIRQVTNVTSATGSFESNAITTSSTNKMGAIITYQDQAGTNALNTDIVLQLSADNGSNFTTATMTAMPDFASGIKMAKVNDLAVTAGTQLKYKISFANQANGSKEARIRGVSLQY
jgi:hypothetical protein